MNTQRLVADAKETALGLRDPDGSRSGGELARGCTKHADQSAGGTISFRGAKLAIHMLVRGAYASEYDAVWRENSPNILAGGPLTSPQMVSEQYVLDLEREAIRFVVWGKKTKSACAHHFEDRQTAAQLRIERASLSANSSTW